LPLNKFVVCCFVNHECQCCAVAAKEEAKGRQEREEKVEGVKAIKAITEQKQ